MFFDRFFRKRDEAAELRDRALIAETHVLLLRDLVNHPPAISRTREVRKDAQSYKTAFAETTQRLMRMQGRGGL